MRVDKHFYKHYCDGLSRQNREESSIIIVASVWGKRLNKCPNLTEMYAVTKYDLRRGIIWNGHAGKSDVDSMLGEKIEEGVLK